jgi:hypothetical protein
MSIVDLEFETLILIDAANNNLLLFLPVGKNDKILHEKAYWAKRPRQTQDIQLCDSSCFFDKNDKDFLGKKSYYQSFEIPVTATEYRALQSKGDCEKHISALSKNECNSEEDKRGVLWLEAIAFLINIFT